MIQLRVQNSQARAALQQFQQEYRGLATGATLAGKAVGNVFTRNAITQANLFGSSMRAAGYSLTAAFTAPLVAAGRKLEQYVLDNEKQFTNLEKVYGSLSTPTTQLRSELDQLRGLFKALSDEFGVNQDEVTATAAAWAAAGVSGAALGKSVETTLKASVVGDMSAADAAKSLIAIQAQYGASSADLVNILNTLNVVENQTGISMAGLIQGFERSAGSAANAGVDYRHLAAMLAALTPAAGTAAQAGNALKSILSSLMAPTENASDIFAKMGVNIADTAWKSATANDRLEQMAKIYNTLPSAQQAVVGRYVATNFQISRFSVLMRDVNNYLDSHQKELQAISGVVKSTGNDYAKLNETIAATPNASVLSFLKQYNVDGKDTSYTTSDVTDRLGLMAQQYVKLNASQKAQFTQQAQTTFGVQNFGTILDTVNSTLTDTTNGLSYYGISLNSTVNPLNNAKVAANELNLALTSSPHMLQQMSVIIKNSLSEAIIPLIPIFVQLAQYVAQLAQKFAQLSPGMQKLIGVSLLLLAALGPIMFYVRTLFDAVGALGIVFRILIAPVTLVFRALMLLLGPFGLLGSVIGRVIGILPRLLLMLSVNLRAALLFLPQVLGFVGNAFITMSVLAIRAIAGIPAAFTALAGIVGQVATVVGGALVGAWAGFTSLVATGATAVGLAWLAFTNWLSLAPTAIGVAWYTFTGFLATIPAALTYAWTAFTLWLETIPAVLAAGWATFTTFLAGIPVALTYAWTAFTLWLETIPAAIAAGWAAFTTFMAGIPVVIGEAWAAFTAFVAGIPAVLSGVWTAFTTFMSLLPTIIGLAWITFQEMMTLMPFIISAAWAIVPEVFTGIAAAATAIGGAILAALTSPWGLAIVAILVLVAAFKDKLIALWNNIWDGFKNNNGLAQAWKGIANLFSQGGELISRVFNLLPQGVQNAMMSVVHIVEKAALAVYDLFSYLNPFAHHSPSLVENVQNGMAAVSDSFAGVTGIRAPIMQAYNDIQKFGGALQNIKAASDALDLAQAMKSFKDAGLGPDATAAYTQLTADLGPLKAKLDQVSTAMQAQQNVVDSLQASLDAANNSLKQQQTILDSLKATQQQYADLMNTAKDNIQKFSQTGIAGERAMEDQIFANTQAQKALQLQMMKMEDVTGPIDDVRNKMSALNGEMMTAQGTRAGLQAGGAGSEILSVYDDRIKAIHDEQKANQGTISQYDDMQKALDALQRKGQELDLEKSLQFDGLNRQIDQLTNGINELPFDQIVSGIQSNQAALATYTAAYDTATNAVNAQQVAVDNATRARDAAQAALDGEQAKLDTIKKSYDAVNSAIQSINDSLSTMTDLASKAAAAQQAAKDNAPSIAEKNFDAAAGGNFPDANLGNNITEAGNVDSITDQTQQALDKVKAQFGNFDMLAPIKGVWKKVTDWWGQNVSPIWHNMVDGLTSGFGGDGGILSSVSDGFKKVGDTLRGVGDSGIAKFFSSLWDAVSSLGGSLWGVAKNLYSAFSPDIINIVKELWGSVEKLWETIKQALWPLLVNLKDLFMALWPVIKIIAGVIGAVFVANWKILAAVFEDAVIPVFNTVIDIIRNVIDFISGVVRIITGVVQVIWSVLSGVFKVLKDLFTGNFSAIGDDIIGIFKGVWEGLKNIFGGWLDAVGAVFGAIWNVIKGAAQLIWGIVEGIVMGIVHFFEWLYDVLVGHSIIPDLMDAIVSIWNALWSVVSWVWNNIGKPIFEFIGAVASWLWNNVLKPVFGFIGAAFQVIWDVVSWAWNNIGKPVFELIAAIVRWLWDTVLSVVWAIIQAEWQALMTVLGWAWENIGEPIFNAIADVAQWLWDKVLQPAWEAIKLGWNLLMTAIEWTWDNILKPVWDAISAAAQWLWNNVLSPTWTLIKLAWSALMVAIQLAWNNIVKPVWDAIAAAAQWLWNNVLKPVWDAIQAGWQGLMDAIKWAWDNIVSPVFDTIKSAVDLVKQAFDTAVSGIKTAWDKVQDIAKAPIKFVVETVLNNGLIAGFNWISDKVGGPHIDPISLPQGFADGGQINVPGGGGPRADKVLGLDPRTKTPTAWVSNKEFVVNAAVAQKNLGFLKAFNAGKVNLPMLADGGQPALVNQMMQFVRYKFPNANLNSGYRPGASDYHGQGKAVDLGMIGRAGGAGGQFYADMKQYIFDKVGKNTLELIYDGIANNRPDLKNGKGYDYGASLRAQHTNHVHWAINDIGAISEGGAGDGGGLLSSIGNWIGDAWDGISSALGGLNPINWLTDKMNGMLNGMPGGDWLKQYVTAVPKKLLTSAIDKVKSLIGMGPSGSGGGSPATGALAQWEASGLQHENKPGNWAGPLHTLIMRESGGNPRAINLTDSNAKAGHPSQGLMQTIPSTFAAYRAADLPNDIYDPVANIVAGLRYITNRYGSIFNVQQANASMPPKGYDNGGWLAPGLTAAMNATRRPEAILTARQWSMMGKMIDNSTKTTSALLEGGSGGDGRPASITYDHSDNREIRIENLNLSFPNVTKETDARDFVDNLVNALRSE